MTEIYSAMVGEILVSVMPEITSFEEISNQSPGDLHRVALLQPVS
jgi:hypothetical protein